MENRRTDKLRSPICCIMGEFVRTHTHTHTRWWGWMEDQSIN